MATDSMEVSAQAAPPQMRSAVAIAAALLLGVVACAWSPTLLAHMVYVGCVCVALLGSGATVWLRPPRSALLLAGAAALFGFGTMGWQVTDALQSQLLPQDETRDVTVRGQIVGLPTAEQRRTRFQLRVDQAPAQPEALRGKLLQLAWYDDFGAERIGPRAALHAGARWQLRLKLRAPRGLRNPGGFDAERQALAQRIAATGYVRM
ncbi:ComEC/Rec2 family competence protein, partial [Xanthomonas perforans]